MRGLVILTAVCAASVLWFGTAVAGTLKIHIVENGAPLLASSHADAEVVRKAKAGESFSAFVSTLYNGFYMVEDKQTHSFLYLPFSAAEEDQRLPEKIHQSGEFPLPSETDLSEWQVLPKNVRYTDGIDMRKYRSKADGMLVAHNGKEFPAKYSYNEDYRPRVDGEKLVNDAKRFMGTRYVLGGTTLNGIDCSGLTRVCLANQGIDVVHRASLQALEGAYVHPSQLAPGDLIFFKDDTTRNYLSHVGIYVGSGKFIHAAQSIGAVAVTSLSDKYFKSHFAFARRL